MSKNGDCAHVAHSHEVITTVVCVLLHNGMNSAMLGHGMVPFLDGLLCVVKKEIASWCVINTGDHCPYMSHPTEVRVDGTWELKLTSVSVQQTAFRDTRTMASPCWHCLLV